MVCIVCLASAIEILATDDASHFVVMATSGAGRRVLVRVAQYLRDDAAFSLLLGDAELPGHNPGVLLRIVVFRLMQLPVVLYSVRASRYRDLRTWPTRRQDTSRAQSGGIIRHFPNTREKGHPELPVATFDLMTCI